ncbi:MAG: hypothetical protein K2P58_14875 [Hyphomonadaceae bacterium]|nr:hypothetical protein [Hyphomonadaceae bacterium]
MRLLDQVAQSAEPISVVQQDGRTVLLPGVDTIAAKLRACPLRFVLSDEVAAVCADLAFAADGLLGSCVDIVRAPSPMLWIEYAQGARSGAGGAPNQRIGMLLECKDAAMRAGAAHIVWESLADLGPELCPIVVEFDFDDPAFADGSGLDARRLPMTQHVGGLFDRVRLQCNPQWMDYYRAECADEPQVQAAIQRNVSMVLGDFPFAAAFCLLTMAGRAFERRMIDHSRLNAARAKKRRPALLSHVELEMAVLDSGAEAQRGNGGARHAPRLHFVRGHLVRRRNAVFWRSPHLRGDPAQGVIESRTISVRL